MTARIAARLGVYVEEHRLGQVYSANTGFLLARNPDSVCAPSIAFVRRERIAETDGWFPGPPDVVIELISASDLYSDVMEKLQRYQRAGTPVVVLVIVPLRKGTIYRGSQGVDFTHTLTIDDQIPGWSMTLDDIFTTAR
jgi:Uma2 family endonuclease